MFEYIDSLLIEQREYEQNFFQHILLTITFVNNLLTTNLATLSFLDLWVKSIQVFSLVLNFSSRFGRFLGGRYIPRLLFRFADHGSVL